MAFKHLLFVKDIYYPIKFIDEGRASSFLIKNKLFEKLFFVCANCGMRIWIMYKNGSGSGFLQLIN